MERPDQHDAGGQCATKLLVRAADAAAEGRRDANGTIVN